ncbi:hypothetical protein FRB90_003138 [Tulasnella sp. 427]|nr:hypothetical protein FRB90_003138 [Tulasnella sp. 427]
MDPAAANIFPVIDTWPLRRNFQQKYDAMGKMIWTDRLTHALLTGSLIFPLYSAPGRGMKSGRNEIIALYLYQQTGTYRTPRQCGSKLQHLFTCEEIKSAVENYRPLPDPVKREELLNRLMPLIPSLRAVQHDRPPSPPPRQGKPYSGFRASHVKISLNGVSASFSFLGYAARPDPAANISGAIALELTDLVPRTPVLKAHVVLPPNINVDKWSGIQIEIVFPGANSIEYYTLPRIGDLRGQDLLIKTRPAAGAKFFAPVGPGSLSEILRMWSTEECRRRLIPDVSIIQRFRAGKKTGKMRQDEFLVVVYSFEVAEKESEVSVSIRPAIVIPPVTAATDVPFSIHPLPQDPPPLQTVIRLPLRPETTVQLAAPQDVEGEYGLPLSPVSIAKIAITAPKPRPPNPFNHVQWLEPEGNIATESFNGDQNHRAQPAQVQVVKELDFLEAAVSSSSLLCSKTFGYQQLVAPHRPVSDQPYPLLGNPVQYYLEALGQKSPHMAPLSGMDEELITLAPSAEFLTLQ